MDQYVLEGKFNDPLRPWETIRTFNSSKEAAKWIGVNGSSGWTYRVVLIARTIVYNTTL